MTHDAIYRAVLAALRELGPDGWRQLSCVSWHRRPGKSAGWADTLHLPDARFTLLTVRST